MWPFSMQIVAFGSSLSGKHCLFLHAWCLRSDWDDRCVNKWKIACPNLYKSAWFADKNVFCHPIGFHFYLCNHFHSPVFSRWHSSSKHLQSSPSDTHSFKLSRSITAQELCIDILMVYASRVSFICCIAAQLLTLTSMCLVIHSWMDYWMDSSKETKN